MPAISSLTGKTGMFAVEALDLSALKLWVTRPHPPFPPSRPSCRIKIKLVDSLTVTHLPKTPPKIEKMM